MSSDNLTKSNFGKKSTQSQSWHSWNFYICSDLSSVMRLVNKFVVIYFKLLPSANKSVGTCWAGVWNICLSWGNKMLLNGAKYETKTSDESRPSQTRFPRWCWDTAAGGEQLLSSFSQYLAHADYQQNWGSSQNLQLYTPAPNYTLLRTKLKIKISDDGYTSSSCTYTWLWHGNDH